VKDRYRYFRTEAGELAMEMAKGVLDLDGEGADREAVIARLLRAAHTLKGAARIVGEAEIAALAHAFEDAVTAPGGAPDVGALLTQVDAISDRVAALGSGPREPVTTRPVAAPRLDPTHVELALEAIQDARRAAQGARREILALCPESARPLDAALDSLDADLGRAEARAHDLCLVPASTIFSQLERAARSAARSLDKRISFEARGADLRLDATVISLVRDALLHVVQNAVDHGIESHAERVAAGKPPVGTIALHVTRRGHRASFTCRDDGRGIDVTAVERAAGSRPPGSRRSGGPRRASELVFEPGLSTRSEVTPLSGRGVGLDAVREIVARLHGEVAVESAPGRGATFTITVPVSLSSMPVLVVAAHGAHAAIPIEAVRDCFSISGGSLVDVDDRELALHGGHAVPLLRLGPWLDPDAPPSGARARVGVEIEARVGRAALGVDHLVCAKQVVALPISPLAGPLPLLGAALDPGAPPTLVLDPEGVVVAARRAPRPARRRVLVIDDSLTSRTLEQSILASAGFEVEVAASAEEGLEKARASPYDLFVVDVEMEGVDGFSFVAMTKADPSLSGTPSIIVSSRGSAADKQRGAECGARAWVVKSELAEDGFLDLCKSLSR
jgi:two-component system, chemotaxis family, sensor kinase CheA